MPRPVTPLLPPLFTALLTTVVLTLGTFLVGPVAAAPLEGADHARATFTPPQQCQKLQGKARTRCVKKAKKTWLRKQKRRCATKRGFWIDRQCWTNPRRTTGLAAHRGGSGMTAELTLSAYQRALATGVSTLHVPVRFTQDGAPVVSASATPGARCSDASPVRTGDPEYPYAGRSISTLDAAQLARLECGSWSAPGVRTAPGSRFTTLADLLATTAHQHAAGTTLDLEVPAATDAQLTTLLDRVVGHRVRVSSTDWGLLQRVRRLPGGASVTTVGIDRGRAHPLAAVRAAGLGGWSPVSRWKGKPYLTRARARAARRAGLFLGVQPTTSTKRLRRAVLLGADEVASTRPDLARAVLRSVREATPAPRPVPTVPHRFLARAHAHNDYVHERPLLDALDAGFTSVEADVVLRDGVLNVAHDAPQITPGATLEALYLEPLATAVAQGRQLTDEGRFRLLIDIKDQARASYDAIEAALQTTMADHPGLFRQYVGAGSDEPAPVEVVVSGARPLAHMQSQTERWIGFDGRPSDLDAATPLGPDLMPLVSQSWWETRQWSGAQPMTQAEQERLEDLLTRTHAQGAAFRFWGTDFWPSAERNRIWTALYDLGFDAINADDLTGFAQFVENRDPWYLAP